jgi:hypothetical protein
MTHAFAVGISVVLLALALAANEMMQRSILRNARMRIGIVAFAALLEACVLVTLFANSKIAMPLLHAFVFVPPLVALPYLIAHLIGIGRRG